MSFYFLLDEPNPKKKVRANLKWAREHRIRPAYPNSSFVTRRSVYSLHTHMHGLYFFRSRKKKEVALFVPAFRNGGFGRRPRRALELELSLQKKTKERIQIQILRFRGDNWQRWFPFPTEASRDSWLTRSRRRHNCSAQSAYEERKSFRPTLSP